MSQKIFEPPVFQFLILLKNRPGQDFARKRGATGHAHSQHSHSFAPSFYPFPTPRALNRRRHVVFLSLASPLYARSSSLSSAVKPAVGGVTRLTLLSSQGPQLQINRSVGNTWFRPSRGEMN